MSNIKTGDHYGSFSSGNTGEEVQQLQNHFHWSSSGPPTTTTTTSSGSTSQPPPPLQPPPAKKKRNPPGNPDPTAEVIALSPTTLLATNRFVCEICKKGFQRDQNLQLHRRGHNLPWKLRQRTSSEVRKRVYTCPEPSCVHHDPARALGDLTGIKKHYSRKHGEKKWKCDKCLKKYGVQSDWKAHQKNCGTRDYHCDCGTIFSRRDSFITHRAFCDALAEETNKINQGIMPSRGSSNPNTSMGLPKFSNYGTKIPLKSLSQDLLHPKSFKPANMSAGMFSTSLATLYGGPRTTPSSSSTLHLSSNISSCFNYHQNCKNSSQLSGGSAQMSATALMAGRDQLSGGMRSSYYGATDQHGRSYEHYQTQLDQSTLLGIGGGGLINPQEISRMFDSGLTSGSSVNDLGMFGGMFMNGGDHERR